MQNSPAVSREWMANRLQLFQKYCLAAMKAQTNHNYTWLVFLSAATDPQDLEQIADLAQNGDFEIVITDLFNPETIRNEIRKRCQPAVQYLITTRLDNDDSVANVFVARIQEHFREQSMQFINFSGFCFSNGCLLYLRLRCNPFISLIESYNDDFKTVMFDEHWKLAEFGSVLNVDEPLWVQVIHDSNLANKEQGNRASMKLLRSQFSCNWSPSEKEKFDRQEKMEQQMQEACVHCSSGRPHEARELIRQILPAWPTDFDLLHILSVAEMQLGHYVVARDLLNQALARKPYDYNCRMNLITCAIQLECFDDAKALAEDGLRFHSESTIFAGLELLNDPSHFWLPEFYTASQSA